MSGIDEIFSAYAEKVDKEISRIANEIYFWIHTELKGIKKYIELFKNWRWYK